ncbi:hypothetical protein DPMN_157971 [Dreissena polymorpha]|uniref:Uncharacterized protein n=1 Tax=Dreissena polymorpha TaxID=45954 RepID=A0A9D4EKH1_DREPO|nr:hypothetical protein DPMN_157971 [Dreissena polymorpha]
MCEFLTYNPHSPLQSKHMLVQRLHACDKVLVKRTSVTACDKVLVKRTSVTACDKVLVKRTSVTACDKVLVKRTSVTQSMANIDLRFLAFSSMPTVKCLSSNNCY